jgi:hypothetical protein
VLNMYEAESQRIQSKEVIVFYETN